MKRLLAIALTISVASCDTSTTADGTSSETQTALQALADNASAIAGQLPRATQASAVLARAAAVDPDSTWAELQATWCDGASESSYGGGMGDVYLDWRSPGTGRDGTRSSCSLKESHHAAREFIVDRLGRFDARFAYAQYDTLERKVYQGSGSWGLRSGLTLIYRSLFADISSRKAVFRQEIELLGTCRIDLAFEDVYSDTGWTNAAIDAPVICGGKTVGHFLWDQVGLPRVVDSRGNLVSPRKVVPATFPEDTLGLRASVVDLERNQRDSTALVRVEVRMRFLDWDTLAVAHRIHFLIPGEGSADSALWPGKPVDTLEFHVRLRDLDGLQTREPPVLYAPFPRGGASSKPFLP